MIDWAPFIAATLRDNSVQELYDEMKSVRQKMQICARRLGDLKTMGLFDNSNDSNVESQVSAFLSSAPQIYGNGNVRGELALTLAEILSYS